MGGYGPRDTALCVAAGHPSAVGSPWGAGPGRETLIGFTDPTKRFCDLQITDSRELAVGCYVFLPIDSTGGHNEPLRLGAPAQGNCGFG